MKKNKLGHTNIEVSEICLGTMTWGSQNTAEEGFEQMDYAVSRGINFFDTAELYAIPPSAETYGRTEEIIGEWFEKTGKREEIILASKIAGPGTPWIREGKSDHSPKQIEAALEESLKRLKTDYIDLYQLHWPTRPFNGFGRLGFQESEVDPKNKDRILDTLQALDKQVRAGKIRTIGLSNETPWGMMTFISLAREFSLPVIVSNQNPYNLLNRSYEVGMAEISLQEKCGLLAYSPLARARLTGKYLDGQIPEGSSKSIDNRKSRYDNPQGEESIRAYMDIAKKHGLDPAQMAIAFVTSRPFVTSNIIGATSMEQLKTNIDSVDVTLSDEVLSDINAWHDLHAYPCP